MPITVTFDLEEASIQDKNDRGRITASFQRLGWENIGGSAWRYPALGTENVSEDWFNHVIPALMYFRSVVEHAGITVTRFTIDAHSEAGYRSDPVTGQNIQGAGAITMYPSGYDVLSENRLRTFISDSADSLG